MRKRTPSILIGLTVGSAIALSGCEPQGATTQLQDGSEILHLGRGNSVNIFSQTFSDGLECRVAEGGKKVAMSCNWEKFNDK